MTGADFEAKRIYYSETGGRIYYSETGGHVLTPIFDAYRKSTPKVGRVADSEGDADAGEDYMLMALRGKISA